MESLPGISAGSTKSWRRGSDVKDVISKIFIHTVLCIMIWNKKKKASVLTYRVTATGDELCLQAAILLMCKSTFLAWQWSHCSVAIIQGCSFWSCSCGAISPGKQVKWELSSLVAFYGKTSSCSRCIILQLFDLVEINDKFISSTGKNKSINSQNRAKSMQCIKQCRPN